MDKLPHSGSGKLKSQAHSKEQSGAAGKIKETFVFMGSKRPKGYNGRPLLWEVGRKPCVLDGKRMFSSPEEVVEAMLRDPGYFLL